MSSMLTGSDLPGPRLNVLRRRAATDKEVKAGRECGECLRCANVHDNGGDTKGLKCMIRGDWTKRFLICDAFEGTGS
jgi:hypothetical protein